MATCLRRNEYATVARTYTASRVANPRGRVDASADVARIVTNAKRGAQCRRVEQPVRGDGARVADVREAAAAIPVDQERCLGGHLEVGVAVACMHGCEEPKVICQR